MNEKLGRDWEFDNRGEPWWAIWSDYGLLDTRFTRIDEARNTARQLAIKNPEHSYVVFKADSEYHTRSVESTYYR